jgi:hypothetical protein
MSGTVGRAVLRRRPPPEANAPARRARLGYLVILAADLAT